MVFSIDQVIITRSPLQTIDTRGHTSQRASYHTLSGPRITLGHHLGEIRQFYTQRPRCSHITAGRTLSTSTRSDAVAENFSVAEMDDALYNNTIRRLEYSSQPQLQKSKSSAEEWLEMEEEPASRFLTRVMDEPTSRFNWRRRASSRVKKVMPKNGERLKKPRRLPPPVSEVDRTRPFFGAFERYSAKYISSLC